MATVSFHNMNSAFGGHALVDGVAVSLFRVRRPRSADGNVPAHYQWSGTVNGITVSGSTRNALRASILKALSA